MNRDDFERVLLIGIGFLFAVALLLLALELNVLQVKQYEVRRPIYCNEDVFWTNTIGRSMQPYSFNEVRPFHPVNISDIQKGDIIVFKHPSENKTVHHSIVKILESGVRTYGYNNAMYDSYVVPFENILYVSCLYGVPEGLR